MAPSQGNPKGSFTISETGHPLPRRASPETSVTLRHHRLSRDASQRANPSSASNQNTATTSSPRRNSSGDSYETGQSDPKKWFDHSNQNPTATFNHNTMDVDPPFFQKESDSSIEEKAFFNNQPAPPKQTAQSSSAGDYRSVIDDLTVEIQKLKEELKRYKQLGPDMLRKDKLFEIKIHGLPARKKRELEATLRDFTASLGGSPDASSSQNKKKSRHGNRNHGNVYSGSGSFSKHASSSSGSNFRPADSAYASMSTGAKSSGTSLGQPSAKQRQNSSEQKVQDYLRDIPEGLYPKHMIMTDKEKRKLVVRRLEQLFTGKLGRRKLLQKQTAPQEGTLAPVVTEGSSQAGNMVHQPPSLLTEPTREARILPTEQQVSGKKSRSADNGSASNSHSHGDHTESGGDGHSSGGSGGTNVSPLMPPPPEQRPTRPRDLDPHRAQVPSENMDYIRHLGLVPPELLVEQRNAHQDVQPDAEGWVYLNLLCSMAQLHIINVTPDFVRSAVSEMSSKFQMSPDGRKIRWRGGADGTKFSSDSSGYNSQKSPSADDSDVAGDISRKRQRTGRSADNGNNSGGSSRNMSKFGPQVSTSSESFHYKPMFVQQSPDGQTSMDETVSSFGPPEESNMGESGWGLSGSGASNRRKRRHDGAIIYYTGAPFCTDLSGDPGDVSPTTQMLSTSQAQQPSPQTSRSPLRRSASGSFIKNRPLSGRGPMFSSESSMDIDGTDSPPILTNEESDPASDIECDLIWSDQPQSINLCRLEPCGLGGVLPDDHFVVVVTTNRPKMDAHIAKRRGSRSMPDEATDSVIRRLATMSTSSPVMGHSKLPNASNRESSRLRVQYVTGRVQRMATVPLPPPAMFFPPFSTDESGADDMEFGSEDGLESSSAEEFVSRRANPHQSDDYPDGVDLTSGDEDGEDPDDSPGDHDMYEVVQDGGGAQSLPSRMRPPPRRSSSAAAAAGTARESSKSTTAEVLPPAEGSSVATAGGVESGYTTSSEGSS